MDVNVDFARHRGDYHLPRHITDHYLSEIRPQIQVTLNCNLECAYCFQEHEGPVMRLETAKAIIDQIVQTYYLSPNPKVDKPLEIYWHGGEPLIAGYKFFKGILDIQSTYPEVHFQNHLQTNATLMNESLVDLFVDNRFQMGFSLDGPEDLHDLHRRTRKLNRGTFRETMRGIELYQSRASLDRVPIMMVATTGSLGRCRDIYDFFHSLGANVGIDIFDIVATDLGGDDGSRDWQKMLAPSAQQIGDFMIEMFDLWFYDPSQRVNFREFRDEVKIVLQEDVPLGEPFHKKRCHTTRTIFGYDGNVYSCDQYINDAKSALGNVHQDQLKDIVLRNAMLWESIKTNLRGKREQGEFSCPSCDWASQCAGGCITCMKYNSLLLSAREQGKTDDQWTEILDRPTPLDSLYGEFYYCSGLIRFRDHIRSAIRQELQDEPLLA